MLIKFSVENFLSFADKQTLDLTAIKTLKERLIENTFSVNEEKLLKTSINSLSSKTGEKTKPIKLKTPIKGITAILASKLKGVKLLK